MDISSPVGGGKFNKFVKDIIQAEREPVRQIENRKARETEKLKLFQDFLGKVRKLPEVYKDLESFKKFREMKADWPAKDMLDVIVDKDKAVPGEYQLEVTQLAGRHSMISDGYETPDDEIGIGFFSYDLPNGGSKSIYIGPSNNTLRGLVTAINDAPGIGVTASLVNDGSDSGVPWRVVVTTKKSGMSNDIYYPDFYFLDGDIRFYQDEERSAQSAIVKFNGFEILSENNRFELLPGVVVDLKQAKEDYEFTLNITEDLEKISGKVKALVDAINTVLDFIYKQNKLDASSDTSRSLGGDTTLFTAESRVRSWVMQAFEVDPDDEDIILHLSDVGVQFQKNGQLNFDADKFKKNLAANFDYVGRLFAGEGNFIQKVKEMTDGFLRPETGVLVSREKGIQDRIRRMDDDIVRKEANLSRRETALKRQFAQLEGLMNSIQGQQQFLGQAFGAAG